MTKILIISQKEVTNVTGGAITIFNNLSNLLAEKGFDVTSCCYGGTKNRPKLSPKVKFIDLKYEFDENSTYSYAINRYLKENQQDLIIFFFTYLYTEANLNGCFDKIPRILMYHSRPDIYNYYYQTKKNLKCIYKNTTSQILLPSFYNLLPDFVQKGNVAIIGNPVKQQTEFANLKEEKKKIVFLSRVDECKGVDFLIQTFSKLKNSYPDWVLHIWGYSNSKEYEKYLINLIKNNKSDKNIKLMGVTNKPLETLRNYDFCIFPSLFEGWGIGLTEALSVGLPAIGLRKCSAVNELIIDGFNGFLTEKDYDSMANKIKILIENKELRIKMGKNAIESVKKYDETIINTKWLDLIEKTLTNKKIEKPILDQKGVECFSIKELFDLSKPHYRFLEKIFSVKNSSNKKHKIICILGIKINLRKNTK